MHNIPMSSKRPLDKLAVLAQVTTATTETSDNEADNALDDNGDSDGDDGHADDDDDNDEDAFTALGVVAPTASRCANRSSSGPK